MFTKFIYFWDKVKLFNDTNIILANQMNTFG